MGTWHSWKFLPILGKYVVNMLDGKLSEEETERWHWDRKMDELKREKPRELKDIKGYSDIPALGKDKQSSSCVMS